MYQYRPLLSVSVSSRAPVWGASCSGSAKTEKLKVSSRAPVWGASEVLGDLANFVLFQVVPPCGGHPFCYT